MSEGTAPTTEQRMDPELKAKWLEALRSGQYKQGQKALQPVEGCYCCLGVLADLCDPKAWSRHDGERHWRAEREEWDDGALCWNEDRTTALPVKLMVKIGLSQDKASTLVGMNDGATELISAVTGVIMVEAADPKPFSEIADWIEANL